MAAPDIPAAKRAGLPVDLRRLTLEGDGWLSPEDRYALKTHGVCPQGQDGMFMVRVRVPGGVLLASQARGLARLAATTGADWLHLTTRQSVELHWVEARQVEQLLASLAELGLTTRSACGHTLRNVMCSEDAGLGLDEPFDCFPDARLASDTILARSAELNVTLPSRINLAFGGSPRCREDALLNDVAFVSVLRGGEAGYELWAGGSLGKAPRLAVQLSEFVPRERAMAAVEACIDVFVEHGDLERPSKGRMKFVVDELGEPGFVAAWEQAFRAALEREHPVAPPIDVLDEIDHIAVLSALPPGGWSAGVRPQRRAGHALVTVGIPLGDTCGSELSLLADLTDRFSDGALVISRDQDLVLRDVAVGDLPELRARLATRGLAPLGTHGLAELRACTGATVCAVGITDSPAMSRTLAELESLRTCGPLRVYVSGCPNSCAQHQAADIGLAGSKVRVGGRTTDGYHVFLGADLDRRIVGEVVGRVSEADLPSAVDALVGLWQSTRGPGEPFGRTVRRLGLEAVEAHLQAVLAHRWASGAEPELIERVQDVDATPVALVGAS
jgi:sulfite reductase beta subunit-like hemoprotein